MNAAIIYLIAAWGCIFLCVATVKVARTKAWWWVTVLMGFTFIATSLIELALETV